MWDFICDSAYFVIPASLGKCSGFLVCLGVGFAQAFHCSLRGTRVGWFGYGALQSHAFGAEILRGRVRDNLYSGNVLYIGTWRNYAGLWSRSERLVRGQGQMCVFLKMLLNEANVHGGDCRANAYVEKVEI